MSQISYLFSYPSNWQNQPIAPFVLDDTLLHFISQQEEAAACHFWPSHQRIILGAMDRRLPYLHEAFKFLQSAGYSLTIRTAGGLGVVDDPGVLNFSLLLPNPDQKISINGAYDIMFDLIHSWLAPYQLDVTPKEVPDSYCPGSYDLTVQGKKIAGLAQRRLSKAIGIMIYISLSGDQLARGQLMKDFYQVASGQPVPPSPFPSVCPSSMTTIEELIGLPFTRDQAINSLLTGISHRWPLQNGQVDWLDHDRFTKNWQKIASRQPTTSFQL